MERSGSQKVLLVLSIIQIVVAALALVMGVMSMAGGALMGADSSVTADVSGAMVGSMALMAGGVLLVSGLIELLVGILGVRAANDNQKIMPVWVLALIELLLYVIALVIAIVQGEGGLLTYIVGIILSLVVFWLCNNIKRQAGK